MKTKKYSDKLALAADQNVKEARFWMDKLAGDPVKTAFPPDYNNHQPERDMKTVGFSFSPALYEKVKKISGGVDVKLHMVLTAALVMLLQKYTGNNDIIIGSPILKQQVDGDFINRVLAFRCTLQPQWSFKELLLSVRQTIVDANEHQNYPFAVLADRLGIGEADDPCPLLDTALLLDPLHDKDYLRELEYNVLFTFKRDADVLEPGVEYNAARFKPETVALMAERYMTLLDEVLTDVNIPLHRVTILSPAEKQQILSHLTGPTTGLVPGCGLPRLLRDQTDKTPQNIALRAFRAADAGKEGAQPQSLTFAQLFEQVVRLAALLRARGVNADSITALMLEPSLEMFIALLAVMEAGGAYLPVDPAYPGERIDFMLADSNAGLLLSARIFDLGGKIRFKKEIIHLDDLLDGTLTDSHTPQVAPSVAADPTQAPPWPEPLPEHAAYVIYTSGTTGKPKGVAVEHRNAVAYLNAFYHYFDIGPRDAVIQLASYAFDVFIEEFFTVLLRGGKVVVPDPASLLDIDLLARTIAEEKVTVVDCTPLLLKEFDKIAAASPTNPLTGVRIFISGGDVLKREYVGHLMKTGTVYNTYGPTESTVCAAYHRLLPDEAGTDGRFTPVPIGKPIADYRLFILDNEHAWVPMGIAGELCIAGAGVTRGYLNRPELTDEKFVSLQTDEGGEPVRMYKSGDLVRLLPDGEVEFLGRKDHQVKIRGYRIETEEIENRLLKHEAVADAVVTVLTAEGGDGEDDKFLCAYVTGGAFKEESPAVLLREYLSKQLPTYMVPSFFVALDHIPLTPNGKIDRKALPKPAGGSAANFVEPQTPTQERMQKIWRQVLGTEKIGIYDNFFDVGGHSLRGVQVINDIHKEFNVKIPLADMFNTPTIKELADLIETATVEEFIAITPVEKREYYPLSAAQTRLYFLQQMEPDGTAYNMPLVRVLNIKADRVKLEKTFQQLIQRHESLRTSFVRIDDVPMQRVHDQAVFTMDYFELSAQESRDFEAVNRIIAGYLRPFDLAKAPLLRSAVIKMADKGCIWLSDIHHIISDGTSSMVLVEDFMALYTGETLPELRIQYKDFSQWQNRLIETGGVAKQEAYWLSRLGGEIPRLQLPVDYKRPPVFTFEGAGYTFYLEPSVSHRFRALSAAHDGTLYMNILAALNALFYKYTRQEDIVVGCGIAGRHHTDLQKVIGMFVNTQAMRNAPSGHKSYETLMKEVIANSIDAFENQDVQFEDLVDKLTVERDPSRNPLFDITMVVQNFGPGAEGNGNVNLPPEGPNRTAANTADGLQITHITTKFDITLFVYEVGAHLYFGMEYYTAIFKEETIARMIAHFKRIVAAVVENPALKLEDIDILTPEEREIILYEFNNTASQYPRTKDIVQLFEEQVRKTPTQVALVGHQERGVKAVRAGLLMVPAGDGAPCLTYEQLNAEAQRLANYLRRETGVRRQEPVGLLLDRSLNQMVAVLGILKSGGAYLPMAPDFPEARIRNMIDDAAVRTVIGEKRYVKTLNRIQWECAGLENLLCIDSEDFHGEEETETGELMSRKLWEYVGETAVDEVTGGGWNSSYTGQPIPREQMDEYGDNILKKLEPLLHKDMRVLEIGAASGITMFRIAPKVGLYYGTDLSRVIIEKNKARIAREGHGNIKLSALAAHDIHRIGAEEKDFDLVIINSVIQCFKGHNYLRDVVGQIIELMSDKGLIFFGDLMDQDLKRQLIADLTAFRKLHKGKNYKTKTDWSEELFISRAFLEDLRFRYPALAAVQFSHKIYTMENELTRYRYDALLTVDKTGASGVPGAGAVHKRQHDLRHLRAYPVQGDNPEVGPHGAAYIIYTSGSTGTPKGVLVEHRNVVRLVKNTNYYDFPSHHRILQTGALEFDASTFEVWGALLNGMQLHLAHKDTILTPGMLKHTIAHNGITTMWMTAPLFNRMVETDIHVFQALSVLLVGGDVLSPPHIERFRRAWPHISLINGYGPTENTTFSTTFSISGSYGETIPIGKPIANSTALVLDGGDRLQPVGVEGELVLGGDGVSRGYLNNPELTALRFVDGPLTAVSDTVSDTVSETVFRADGREGAAQPAQRYYRTGDLARFTAGGDILFAGRADHQVKVRGYRIELGEIDRKIRDYFAVADCVVVTRDDNDGKYICAYIVSEAGVHIEESDLKDHLALVLPDFMVPAYFVMMDELPLVPTTGKINRAKLPDPRTLISDDFVPPRDAIDQMLVDIWADVLGLSKESVGIDANFFELGGHSLKATVLTSKIHKQMEVRVPLAEIFSRQTVRLLADYIKTSSRERYAAIDNVEKKDYYPLSAAQKRLFIIQSMDVEDTQYNMPYRIPLGVDYDAAQLDQLLDTLIRRHDSLRTSFHMLDEEPVQRVHDPERLAFRIEYEHEVPAGTFMKTFRTAFPLHRAPLLRAAVKVEGQAAFLMVEMHHIISDGVSQTILERELRALRAGEALSPLRLQYKDFAQWQNSRTQQAVMKAQEAFWLKEFAGRLPVLDLNTDYPRPLMQSVEGNHYLFFLDVPVVAGLKRLAADVEGSLYMVVLAVLNVLFAKLSSQEDIIIGTPVAARRHSDLQDIIGMFVGTLAMRNYPQAEKTFMDFLEEVKERTLNVYENQEYQFEDLVDKTNVERDAGRNPLFDIMFNLLNLFEDVADLPGIDMDQIYFRGPMTANFDITFQGGENGGAFYCTVDYCTKLFKDETILRYIRYFKTLVAEILADPYRTIGCLDMLYPQEKERLLYDFNRTRMDYAHDKTLHQLIARHAVERPHQMALRCCAQTVPRRETGRDVYPGRLHTGAQLTYFELNRLAGIVAALLIEKGVKPDTIVAVCALPCTEMYIALLGIMKSGAAYLPLDPRYPEDRTAFMLSDSRAPILVTLRSMGRSDGMGLGIDVIYLDDLLADILDRPQEFPAYPYADDVAQSPSGPQHLVYVCYTSGTTGNPKGVAVEHRNVLNYIQAFNNLSANDHNDITCQLSSYAFDIFVEAVYPFLSVGGQVVVPDSEGLLDFDFLGKLMVENVVTILDCIPALLKLFNDTITATPGPNPFRCIRKILVGGDVVKHEHLHNFLSYVEILNGYGPTEATVCITFYRCKPEAFPPGVAVNIPIGNPIGNYKVYILDNRLQLQPMGVAGELCTSGVGLSRGYINRPELTAEKFPPNPFEDDGTSLENRHWLYRTGDLARWLPDGNIQFLGRIDNQVKIRGFRVELGEIESHLANLDLISEAVVMDIEINGDTYLCAYVVPEADVRDAVSRGEKEVITADAESLMVQEPPHLDVAAVKEALGNRLPDYMIPTYFVPLHTFPKTNTRKIDRKALSRFPVAALGADAEIVAPRGDTEVRLVKIWAEVLKREPDTIGVTSNFFQLGGHSLKATIMSARIHREFNVKVPLGEVFANPTIAHIAQYLGRAGEDKYAAIQPVEKKEYYPLSAAQQRMFVLSRVKDAHDTSDNTPQVMQLTGQLDVTAFQSIVRQLIQRHEVFRTSFHLMDDQPVQVIHDHVDFEMEHYRLESGADVSGVMKRFVRPFDLSRAPLLRVGLAESSSGGGASMLMYDMHHIITDGSAGMIFLSEFRTLAAGGQLPPLRIQYKDFTVWQNAFLRSDAVKPQEAYWLNRFAGELPVLKMPLDFPRPAVWSSAGKSVSFGMEPRLVAGVNRLKEDGGATLFMILLAAYNILLARYSGQEDIIVGTPIAGRPHADLQNVVGFFINTLALRNHPTRDKSFRQFLAEVKGNALDAYSNQDYQFETLVERLGIQRDKSRSVLFDTMLVVQNADAPVTDVSDVSDDSDVSGAPDGVDGADVAGASAVENRAHEAVPVAGVNDSVTYTGMEFEEDITQFDIITHAFEMPQGISFKMRYGTTLFKHETIETLIRHFMEILESAVNDPDILIRDIKISQKVENIQTEAPEIDFAF